MSSIHDLTPRAVWQYFHQLTQIPRPSHHEEAVQQYVLDEAARLGLDAARDAAGNVRVRKAASAGYEHAPGVILQAHLDMVPQKNADKVHDFTQDPISTRVGEDGWLHAEGTTLGADNGIGVAAILAVLADSSLPHPPLEALFTATEETGMSGAKGLQGGWLNGKYLLNLDYEDEGELCIGCAGGVDGSYRLPYRTQPLAQARPVYRLNVRGLSGGHSGIDIHKQRGNAIKILAQVLDALTPDYVVDIAGGNMRNAIPREAQARIVLAGDDVQTAKAQLQTLHGALLGLLPTEDHKLVLELTADGDSTQAMDKDDGERLIAVLRVLPNGVDRMSLSMPELVESSTNLAAISCENNALHIHCLLRAANEDAKDDLAARMADVVVLAGGSAEYTGDYGGWLPRPQSSLVQIMQDSGKAIYGHTPPLKAIHAGLECGILAEHYPHWEMIAFGPTITGPHSPDERVEIASVARFYQWLTGALASFTS